MLKKLLVLAAVVFVAIAQGPNYIPEGADDYAPIGYVNATDLLLRGVFDDPQTFTGPQVSYNEKVAKDMIRYCAAAYSSKAQPCVPNGFTVTSTFTTTVNGVALVGYAGVDATNKRLVLAYRGSTDFSQLVDQATKAYGVDYNDNSKLKVAQYWYTSYQKMQTSTRNAIKDLLNKYPSYPLIVTGHSLGGALASWAALDLTSAKVVKSAPTVYTFGEPRIGNFDFAKYYSGFVPNVLRVVHWRDMVSHLPPCATTLDAKKLKNVCTSAYGFPYSYHSGTEIFYQSNMGTLTTSAKYQVCTGTPWNEDTGCSNGLLITLSIDDHRNYFGINVGGNCKKLNLWGDDEQQQPVLTSEMQNPELIPAAAVPALGAEDEEFPTAFM